MDYSSLFRKKSLDRVSSPDQIDDYIKITTPPVWLILAAIGVVLAGALVWGIFGEITVNTAQGAQTVAPISFLIP